MCNVKGKPVYFPTMTINLLGTIHLIGNPLSRQVTTNDVAYGC